jgi:hypothetical protein
MDIITQNARPLKHGTSGLFTPQHSFFASPLSKSITEDTFQTARLLAYHEAELQNRHCETPDYDHFYSGQIGIRIASTDQIHILAVLRFLGLSINDDELNILPSGDTTPSWDPVLLFEEVIWETPEAQAITCRESTCGTILDAHIVDTMKGYIQSLIMSTEPSEIGDHEWLQEIAYGLLCPQHKISDDNVRQLLSLWRDCLPGQRPGSRRHPLPLNKQYGSRTALINIKLKSGCTREHVRRRSINEVCPICYEDELMGTLSLSELVWCKDGCGRSFHRRCWESWASVKREEGDRHVRLVCAFW